MNIGEIIKNYRVSKGISQRDFAKLSKCSNSYIAMLEKNINYKTKKNISPTIEIINNIAQAMGYTLDDFLKLLDDSQPIIVNTKKSTTINVYGTIPAGIPMECIEDIVDTEEITEDMLKGDREYFGLKIKGDSMYPEYLDGDIIILEKVADAESGSDCVVMVNGEDGTFKRIYKTESGLILQPLNSTYQPLNFTNDEIIKLPVKIIGKVVELRRKK